MQRLVLRNVYNCGEDTSHDHGHWDIGALLEAAPAGKIVVGRNESASIQIDSTLLPAMISRRHAELHCDHEGAIFLTDRQSMNGTWVNGLRLEPFQGHELKADDLVSFGGTRDVTRKLKSIVNPFVYRVDVSAGRRATTAHEVVDLANSPVSRPASASEECVCADQENEAATGNNNMDNVSSELECSICRDLLVAPMSLVPCGHTFCATCLERCLRIEKSTHTCCLCRAKSSHFPVKVTVLKSMLHACLAGMAPADQKRYRERETAYAAIEPQVQHAMKAFFEGPRTRSNRSREGRRRNSTAGDPLAAMERDGERIRNRMRADPNNTGVEALERRMRQMGTAQGQLANERQR